MLLKKPWRNPGGKKSWEKCFPFFNCKILIFFLLPINSNRKGDTDITIEKLRDGGVDFENFAAVSRGIQQTCTRTCLPFLYDERDFISYGEVRLRTWLDYYGMKNLFVLDLDPGYNLTRRFLLPNNRLLGILLSKMTSCLYIRSKLTQRLSTPCPWPTSNQSWKIEKSPTRLP